MAGQVVKIAGTVVVAEGAVGWPIRSGVEPVIQSFKMPRAEAERLLSSYAGKTVTLEINDDGGTPLKVEKLYILRVDPGDHPHLARLVVADRRWLWSRCHILRRYNMHRAAGYIRATTPGGAPEAAPIVDDILYARWSLFDTNIGGAPVRWSSETAMRDLLKKLQRFEKKFSGESFSFTIAKSLEGGLVIPVEETELDDAGDSAVSRLLAHLGMGDITVLLDGTVSVWNRADGGERKLVEEVKRAPIIGRGYIELVDFAQESPKKIRVGFTKEHELRFSFSEPTAKSTTATDDDELKLDNVLPSPDFSLTAGGDTVPQGTWLTIPEALNAWGAPPGLGRLDYDLIRKAFVPFIDLWAAILISGQRDGNADWAARISALQQHWRKTFRISRRWMDRILKLLPFRVATVHPTSGTRAPAVAYCDYALMASQRSMWKNALQGKELEFVRNMTGWAALIDENTKPAPAIVTILDHDQGIIHVDFLQDPARVYDVILPGQVDLSSGVPGHDFESLSQNIGWNAVIDGGSPPSLSSGFKLDVILTAIPGSPNTDGQLYWEEVEPADVLDLLPPGARKGIANSRGPVAEIRVGPGIETARCGWSDADAEVIKSSFGVGQDKEPEGDAPYADISKLVINTSTGNAAKAAGVRSIALAVAAREWMRYATRYMGSAVTRMRPELAPAGFLTEAAHTVLPDGEAVTTIGLLPQVPSLDLLALMDASTRALVMRSVEAGK